MQKLLALLFCVLFSITLAFAQSNVAELFESEEPAAPTVATDVLLSWVFPRQPEKSKYPRLPDFS